MVVAAGFTGEVMFLVPFPSIGKSDFEPRATEIFVHVSIWYGIVSEYLGAYS